MKTKTTQTKMSKAKPNPMKLSKAKVHPTKLKVNPSKLKMKVMMVTKSLTMTKKWHQGTSMQTPNQWK
jgi:hypothetical protein